ncbi:Oxytetracycline polyketide synthase acyl carrier protein [Frankia sp. AiPs1]|uniref:acyl carrier protein n=1 Tax=Frankia sp. AiPa1 TaxID=573492 RepID=UPI00202B3377|nr:acyl carrier protein [Frankia sp. AiPa1]MCL9760505.1 acyl carrier protein [Frankia sp. AiPa1]
MATRELTIDDLTHLLRSAAGEEEGVDLDGDILDTEFATLGYDSLALLETASRLGVEYGVTLTDDDLEVITTPRALLDRVNTRLGRG